jgi:hypothetical protein
LVGNDFLAVVDDFLGLVNRFGGVGKDFLAVGNHVLRKRQTNCIPNKRRTGLMVGVWIVIKGG